ncbi:MAG: transcriptional regulator [Roseiarcus sp.]
MNAPLFSPPAGVNVNGSRKTDFLANARKGWGEAPPDWVIRLAEECVRSSASDVAQRLDYSVAVISGVVLGHYKGDVGKVEAKVRGAYMGAVVECPILGEIERDRCIAEQRFKHSATSAMRAKLYRACRSGCEHSRLKKEGGDV